MRLPDGRLHPKAIGGPGATVGHILRWVGTEPKWQSAFKAGAIGTWARDRFTLTSSGAQTKNLSFVAAEAPLFVFLNGVYQDEGTDFTVADNTLSALSAMGATAGDVLEIRYIIRSTTPPAEMVQAASADDSSSGTATATFSTATTAGSLLVAVLGGRANTTSMPAGWVSVSKVYSTSTDSFVEVWFYEDAPATTSVAATTDISNGMRLTMAEFSGMPSSVTATLGGTLIDSIPDGTTFTPSAAPGDGLAVLGWNSRYGFDMGTRAVGYTDVGPGDHDGALGYATAVSGVAASAVLSPNDLVGTNAMMIVYLT